jgi:hypothetical protein
MAIGRSDSLQELITLMDSIYGETIIGSDINLIKHLFYYLKSENAEFDIEYEERIMTARVEVVSADSVTLNVLGFEDWGNRRAKVRFEVINVLYVFEVIIDEIKENLVTIRIPTELQSAEMRKHRRVPCDDLFMNFVILFQSYKGGRYVSGDNINAERRFTHLFREIKKDEPDLKLMNLIITEYVTKISSEYQLCIYNFQDEWEDFEEIEDAFDPTEFLNLDKEVTEEPPLKRKERIERAKKLIQEKKNITIKKVLSNIDPITGRHKSIYVRDCSVLDSYIEIFDHPQLKTWHELYSQKEIETDVFDANTFFENLMETERREFIVSYIIAPLTLFDKVIGHLMVYTTAMDKYILTQYDAEYIHEMVEIASYGFTKIAIKGNRLNILYTNTKIVDISITGLRFEIYDEKLYQYLKKHNTIKMFIPIGQKTLTINGEILRYEDGGDTFRMGVNYISSEPDDMKVLENYIYEKKGNILSE